MIKALFDEEYFPVLNDHILSARRDIFFTVFHANYSHKSNTCPVHTLLKSLILKRQGGVHISGIFPSLSHNFPGFQSNIKIMNYLSKNNINCFTLEMPSIVHSKFFVIDHLFLFVGSHNLTRKSLTATVETSILITDDKVVIEFLDRFNFYLTFSKKYFCKYA